MRFTHIVHATAKVAGSLYQILLFGVMGYYLIQEVRKDANDRRS